MNLFEQSVALQALTSSWKGNREYDVVVTALSGHHWAPAVLGPNSNSTKQGSSEGPRQAKHLFNLLHPPGSSAQSPLAPGWILDRPSLEVVPTSD